MKEIELQRHKDASEEKDETIQALAAVIAQNNSMKGPAEGPSEPLPPSDEADKQDMQINTSSAASMRLSTGLLNATHAKYRFQKALMIFAFTSMMPFMAWNNMYDWWVKNMGAPTVFYAGPLVYLLVVLTMSCFYRDVGGLNGMLGFDTVSNAAINKREDQLGAEFALKSLDCFDDRMVRRQALPKWSGPILMVSYTCMALVSVLGDTRLASIEYRCCDGLETTIKYEGCKNKAGELVPVGGLINSSVLVRICKPLQAAPFLANVAQEQMPICLAVNSLFGCFYAVMFAASVILAWETTEEIRRIMKHEEKTILQKHGKMGQEWFTEISNIINQKVREKLGRSLGCGKSEQTSAWVVGSIICSICAVFWLPSYVIVYYRAFVGLLDMVAMFVSCCALYFLFLILCYGLQFPFLMYYKSQMAMTILYYAPLDFQHLPHLQLWRRLRSFYTQYRMPVDHSLAQQPFALFCFVGAFCLLMIMVRVYTQGFASYRSLPMYALTFVSFLCSIYSWVMMTAAVEVWTTMRNHLHLLKDTRFMVMVSHNTHKRLKISTSNWMQNMNSEEDQEKKLADMMRGKSQEEQEKIRKEMAAGTNMLEKKKEEVSSSSSDSDSSDDDRAALMRKKKALLAKKKAAMKKKGKKGKVSDSDSDDEEEESEEEDKKKKGKGKGGKDDKKAGGKDDKSKKGKQDEVSVAAGPVDAAAADAKAKAEAAKKIPKGEKLKLTPVEVLEDLTETVELFDEPPVVFGMRMDNFFPHVLRGYFLFCFIAMAAKYGLDNGNITATEGQ